MWKNVCEFSRVVTINENGTIKYTPNHDYFGTDTFTYTNEDEDSATVTVSVEEKEINISSIINYLLF